MDINLNIQETLSRTVTVKAESIEDAIMQVDEMYKNEEIILDYADYDGQVIIEKVEEKYKSHKDKLIDEVIQYMIENEERHYEESDCPKEHIYLTLKKLKAYL